MAKLHAEERRKFIHEKLEEQRHLLRHAIEAMASGDLTHALHVATTIRVLVHETGRSKPLLKQLKVSYLDLPILDRAVPQPQEVPKGRQATVFWCPVSATLSAPSGTIGLITDLDSPDYVQSVLGAWWEGNPCMVLPGLGPVYRRELALGLANNEGGAHVDPDIPKRYQAVMSSGFVVTGINQNDVTPLNISRLVTGKAGVELLDCLDKNFPVAQAMTASNYR